MSATHDAAAPNRHHELGAFLRARRERLTPASVGLQPGPRRRTPGLRREEVAALCGVSVTWYTWIEQGREVSVSATALANLARVLRIGDAERAYLFELGGKLDPASRHSAHEVPSVPAALRALVDAMSVPAYVLDAHWNACAWNARAAARLSPWLRGGESNLLRFVFQSPAAADLMPDWPERARRIVAEFRVDYGRQLDDPWMTTLVDDLLQSSVPFAQAWHAHDVLEREGGERSLRDAQGHVARVRQVSLDAASFPGFRVVALMPT